MLYLCVLALVTILSKKTLDTAQRWRQKAWFGALCYLALGVLWITLSDAVLAWFISDAQTLSQYQSYKGYFYVSLTAVLAWLLLSQRQRYSRSLAETEDIFSATFELAAVGIAHVGLDGQFIRANTLLCDLLGYSETQLKRLTFQKITHPDDLQKDESALAELLANKIQQYSLEKRYICADGAIIWAQLSVAMVRSNSKPYFISVVKDITQQRQTLLQLEQSELRFRTLLDNAPQLAIQGYLRDGTTFYWNKACEQIYGYSKEEALGSNLLDLIIPSYMRNAVTHAMQQMADSGEAIDSEELALRRKDGSLVPVYSGHAVVKLPDMEPQIYCIDLDLTEHKKQAAELAFLADFDVVTQLPNRQYFYQRVEQAINQASQVNGHCAILLMDLDNFKNINDSYGHAAGDQLLMQISQRLHKCCAPAHTLARLGGDEFGVLVQHWAYSEHLVTLADRLLAQLEMPCKLLDQSEVIITASIGISLYPEHAQNCDELIRAADAAMYKVKQGGRNHVAFYSDELTVQARQRVQLERHLRLALKANKLTCYYQPQIDINSGHIIGAEVLLRWFDDELGFISPDVFIPLAESCGLIHTLGIWVLQSSCKQYVAWQQAGLPAFRLAVNVSAQQFGKASFFAEMQQTITAIGMPPEQMELEVTESTLMLGEANINQLMQQIKQLGMSLAIDDFGTGYSSLSYLKRLPLDILKIDRSFIEHLPDDNEDKQIVRAIISLAHNLNFKVLAEGVETAEQLAFLRQQGCDYYQGYYFSKPIAAADFAALLQQHQQTDNA